MGVAFLFEVMMARKSKYDGIFKAGEQFGSWTVVDGSLVRVGARKNGYQDVGLNVRCQCGTERVVTVYTLKNGASTNCGCLSQITGSANPNWQGSGIVSKTAFLRAVNYVNCSITPEDANGLAQSQSLTCAISGAPLDFSSNGNASLMPISGGSVSPGNAIWVSADYALRNSSVSYTQYLDSCKTALENAGWKVTKNDKVSNNPLINACIGIANKHKGGK
jgi:hypothetical protein